MGTKELLKQVSAVVRALEGVDPAEFSNEELETLIDQLCMLLWQVEALRDESVDELRARGFTIAEQAPAIVELELSLLAKRTPLVAADKEMPAAA
jgi:hypothetical protein